MFEEANVIEDPERAFKPLEKYADEQFADDGEAWAEFVGSFMYMYTKNDKNYYKHVGTREYLVLPAI